MKGRLAIFALLIGIVATATAWGALQPLIIAALRIAQQTGTPAERSAFERASSLLPFWLAGTLLCIVALSWAILYLAVERPLKETQELLERAGPDLEFFSESRPAPLVSRLHSTLSRTFRALAQERERAERQVTELESKNAELTRTRTELFAAERLATLGRLSAGIAHEVGNPLSGVLGYLALAESRLDRPLELKNLLGLAEAEVRRIDGIVRGLLELGRPSTGALRPVDVAEVIERCMGLVRGAPEFKSVEVALSSGPGLIARADPGPLAQVLINLLLNAAQAIAGAGHIQLTASRSGERIQITIVDTGPGLPPGDVFEPFFTTKPSTGTGLGLAVSLHLVRAMQGEIRAEASPAGGARFIVELAAA